MYTQNNRIIDDGYNINNLIKFFLLKEGYKVAYFTDSIEALNYYRKDKYDLVLFDAKIPKLKEMSLYQKFRNR